MSNSLNKIAPNSPSRQNPSEVETSIANASLPTSCSVLVMALLTLRRR
jgi:hypothetical protein